MNTADRRSSRRAFLKCGGGAALVGSAGIAVAAAASSSDGRSPPVLARNLEPIRILQAAFMSLMERQLYEAAADLFDDHAHLSLSGVSAAGRAALLHLLAVRYRRQDVAVLHAGYRPGAFRDADSIELGADGLTGTAIFHVEAEICIPLQSSCTVAQMARLCGHLADRRWEAGRFDATYRMTSSGEWRFASLIFDGRGV